MEHQLQTSVSATTPAYGSLVRKAPLARAQVRRAIREDRDRLGGRVRHADA
jgi:hypothetical protein